MTTYTLVFLLPEARPHYGVLVGLESSILP